MAMSTGLRTYILVACGCSLGRPPAGIDQPNLRCGTCLGAFTRGRLTRLRLCVYQEGARPHRKDQEQNAKKRNRPQHIGNHVFYPDHTWEAVPSSDCAIRFSMEKPRFS